MGNGKTMSFTLRQILEAKGPGVAAVHPTVPVSDAVALMEELTVGSVLAIEGGALRGIFTERDVVRRIVVAARDPRTTPLYEVMTTGVRCASLDTSIDDAMRMMTNGRHRHLPIEEDGFVLGIVSIGDLVKWVARDLEQYVVDLSSLVCGPSSMPELPLLPPLGRPLYGPLYAGR
jgi:CBS domain-containing protein